MKKIQALEIMLQGGYVRHQNYSPEEHIHMESSHIIDESGYDMGTIHDEFWSQIQKWEEDWEEVEDIVVTRPPFNSRVYPIHNIYENLPNYQDPFYSVPQYRRSSPKVQRNEPCTCGSGKKFKQCCGIVK